MLTHRPWAFSHQTRFDILLFPSPVCGEPRLRGSPVVENASYSTPRPPPSTGPLSSLLLFGRRPVSPFSNHSRLDCTAFVARVSSSMEVYRIRVFGLCGEYCSTIRVGPTDRRSFALLACPKYEKNFYVQQDFFRIFTSAAQMSTAVKSGVLLRGQLRMFRRVNGSSDSNNICATSSPNCSPNLQIQSMPLRS